MADELNAMSDQLLSSCSLTSSYPDDHPPINPVELGSESTLTIEDTANHDYPIIGQEETPSVLEPEIEDPEMIDQELNAHAGPWYSPGAPNADSAKYLDGDVKPVGDSTMQRFVIYETATRFFIVGTDLRNRFYRILKIERLCEGDEEEEELRVHDDPTLYTKKEMDQLLDAVNDGNKASGGLKLRCTTFGLLGFIRFTGTYYMLLITKRVQVAVVGGHSVYQIDGTELISLSLPSTSSSQSKGKKSAEEARFLAALNHIDLTRSFYFSYSYDLTRSLQLNITHQREAVRNAKPSARFEHLNSMFVWNDYLMQPIRPLLSNPYDWCVPIIHGYVDQANISVFGRLIYITLIGRRSRHFVGPRFLKRGVNDSGYVANDVETEQIVSDAMTTSFHAPGPKLFANPSYTSYVQHRGSIPLHWTQDNTAVTPKPGIEVYLHDPFYTAAALHFDNLFERYGAPIYVLNLIKSRERTPRESKLLHEFTATVEYLNQTLPEDNKIFYKAFDMSRASKSRDGDVIGGLQQISQEIFAKTGFFHNGDNDSTSIQLQNGVARTNCIDCLDRTNAAQFVLGKHALGHQMQALGVIDKPEIEYDSDALDMYLNMFHRHGDTIAMQYGGSFLVNTMATYLKTNPWTGHSRDMVESFKRYCNNSFLDAQRQETYNLFLGNYVYKPGEPPLWELGSDYPLHFTPPEEYLASQAKRRNYLNWYTPKYLEKRTMPDVVPSRQLPPNAIDIYDDFWLEHYRPNMTTHLKSTFLFKMTTTSRGSDREWSRDPSPFAVRHNDPEARDKKKRNRRSTMSSTPGTESPKSLVDNEKLKLDIPLNTTSTPSRHQIAAKLTRPLPRPPLAWSLPWRNAGASTSTPTLLPSLETLKTQDSNQLRGESTASSEKTSHTPNLEDLVDQSLHPYIKRDEALEYAEYAIHRQTLPVIGESEDGLKMAQMEHWLDDDWVEKVTVDDEKMTERCDQNLMFYNEFLNVGDEGLTVGHEEYDNKRYKWYGHWLKEKNLSRERETGMI